MGGSFVASVWFLLVSSSATLPWSVRGPGAGVPARDYFGGRSGAGDGGPYTASQQLEHRICSEERQLEASLYLPGPDLAAMRPLIN